MESPAVSAETPRSPRAASHIYLLADDLTGACDAAGAFLSAGHSARVWLGPTAMHSASDHVQAFNTDSRSLEPAEAEVAVSNAARALKPADGSILFKKIDSALRGPLVAELLAAHHAFATQAILLAPSFPSMGRTMQGGVLHLKDACGQRDPFAVASLFPPELQSRIAFVSRSDKLVAAYDSGKTVLLCDATTQADLEAVARAAQPLPRLLYAGSAGLAHAVASLLSASPAQVPLPTAERTLLISGTEHAVTRLQLERLRLNSLAADYSRVRILHICCEAGDDARILAEFERFDPQALVLTGGETALLAARALGAESFILRGEFIPGIPWSIAEGGAMHGRVVITKSGGFGEPGTLSDILNTLSGQA